MSNLSFMQNIDFDIDDEAVSKKLDSLHYQNFIALGGSSIEVELEDDDFGVAFDIALSTYRSMSANSVNRSFGFMYLEPGQQVYKLNPRVDNIIRIHRGRSLFGGLQSGGSAAFESFGAATAHLLLKGGLGNGTGNIDLVTYDLIMQYQETLDRVFAREIQFHYNNGSSELHIYQSPKDGEIIAMELSIIKSVEELLSDHFASNWMREYELAHLRIILGEKLSRFATLPGAQGGTTMNGESLIQRGMDDKQRLEDDLLYNADSANIPLPIRG